MKKASFSMPVKNKKNKFGKFLQYLFISITIAAILVLFSSFLAWRVSPQKTNLFSYLGIIFGFTLFVNICCLILWIYIKNWKMIFISIIALILCYKPITTFFPFNLTSPEVPEKVIKVLTYNVEGFRNEVAKDAEDHPVLEYIAKTDADIVCLQEYMISKTGHSMITQKDINRILNKYPYHSITGLESSGRYHIYGLACFSKYPIENTHEVIFDNSYNGAAVYTINIDDSLYTVVNTHLESNQITAQDKKLYSNFIQNKDSVKLDEVTSNIRTRLGRAYRKRAQQVQKINSYLESQTTEGTIICGDLNDTPISYTYHQLKGDLKDSYSTTAFGPSITYNKDFFLFRIDYIFHSKDLKAYKTKIDRVRYSDHYPLYTFLEKVD